MIEHVADALRQNHPPKKVGVNRHFQSSQASPPTACLSCVKRAILTQAALLFVWQLLSLLHCVSKKFPPLNSVTVKP